MPKQQEDDEVNRHSEQSADETCETVKPIPRRPIPSLEWYAAAVVVMNVFELHTAYATDTHKECSEERHHEDTDEVFPAVGFGEPFAMFLCHFLCVFGLSLACARER